MWLFVPQFLYFSQDTGHLHWRQSMAVLKWWICWSCHTTWAPWSPTRCVWICLWVFGLSPIYAHVSECTFVCCTCKQAQRSLMPVVSLPPFCQSGDTPLHLAARNGHLDAIQSLLQSFDTRDEVNMVDNQCKHRLYHGLVCDSVCSVTNPLLDGGSTLD